MNEETKERNIQVQYFTTGHSSLVFGFDYWCDGPSIVYVLQTRGV